jgi:lysyl-tRNA synthetase class 2
VQRRFAQSIATDAYTGPHDVEKQKRLDQLSKVKPLGDYHPRLVDPASAQSLSLRDFNAKYDSIQETETDAVSVFGMAHRTWALDLVLTVSGRVRSVRLLGSKLMFLDIERDTQRLQVMVELKKLSTREGLDESFKDFKKVARTGDWICKWQPSQAFNPG